MEKQLAQSRLGPGLQEPEMRFGSKQLLLLDSLLRVSIE